MPLGHECPVLPARTHIKGRDLRQNRPVGTNLAQLGAFDAPEVAAQEWVTFNNRYPELLAGKERLILQAERAGKTFYRLRAANFTDLSDARRFCAAFKARNVDCVPVLVR